MNILENILEEIDRLDDPYFVGYIDRYKAKEIIRSHMGEAKDINVHSNAGWIDRKNLKEEIESLRFTITGMRNGKTMTNLALEEYGKSILRIIDEQPTYMDDGWIPVEERLPEEKINPITKDFYVYPVTFESGGVRDIRYYPFGMGHWWKATEIMDEYVKAWMPIPEPYRPKEKNNE